MPLSRRSFKAFCRFALDLFCLPDPGLDESTEVKFLSLLSMLNCIEFKITELESGYCTGGGKGTGCLREPLLPLLYCDPMLAFRLLFSWVAALELT